jgi:hypothetical protein
MSFDDGSEVFNAGDFPADQDPLQLRGTLEIELDGERMPGPFGRPAYGFFYDAMHGYSMPTFQRQKLRIWYTLDGR